MKTNETQFLTRRQFAERLRDFLSEEATDEQVKEFMDFTFQKNPHIALAMMLKEDLPPTSELPFSDETAD